MFRTSLERMLNSQRDSSCYIDDIRSIMEKLSDSECMALWFLVEQKADTTAQKALNKEVENRIRNSKSN